MVECWPYPLVLRGERRLLWLRTDTWHFLIFIFSNSLTFPSQDQADD